MLLPKVTLVEKDYTSYHILKSSISSFCNSIYVRFAQHYIFQNNFTLIKEKREGL